MELTIPLQLPAGTHEAEEGVYGIGEGRGCVPD